MAFFPRDDVYFTLLSRLAAHLAAGAAGLAAAMDGGADEPSTSAAVQQAARDARELTEEIKLRLSARTVAPFDRGDVFRLTGELTSLADAMASAVRTLEDLRPLRPVEEVLQLGHLLARGARALAAAVDVAGDSDGVRERITELRTVREQADQLSAAAMERLFAGTPDPVAAVKQKTLCDILDGELARMVETGRLLEGIALKDT